MSLLNSFNYYAGKKLINRIRLGIKKIVEILWNAKYNERFLRIGIKLNTPTA